MSYWVGTLPGGPYGCTVGRRPALSGPDAPNYPYLASVGFVDRRDDERASLAGSFYHHQGRLPVHVAVPSLGPGVSSRAATSPTTSHYTLVLPDTRSSPGPGSWSANAPDRCAPRLGVFPGWSREWSPPTDDRRLWNVSAVTGKLRPCAG